MFVHKLHHLFLQKLSLQMNFKDKKNVLSMTINSTLTSVFPEEFNERFSWHMSTCTRDSNCRTNSNYGIYQLPP